MFPDGIFDASQGIVHMGVRVRNTSWVDWEPAQGVMVGISPASRIGLASQGVRLLDTWSGHEQAALQQEVSGGFVRVPRLRRGMEWMVYFKVDVGDALRASPKCGSSRRSRPGTQHMTSPPGKYPSGSSCPGRRTTR
ncbi:hypothetical protein ACQPYK_29470 [Streptosporangium sp. CA-135522]|uniref:hypothetical protein n=1 Tax=Streptosporangium sp. CA-135522 TaxID=3240072 RepID=UPI003D947626